MFAAYTSGLVVILALVGPPAAPADDKAPDLSGTWTWSWKDADGKTHKHTLEVEGSPGKYAARERFDDEEAVKVTDLKVVDKKVSFSVQRNDRRAQYSGTIASADTINGKVLVDNGGGEPNEFGWTATREKTKKP